MYIVIRKDKAEHLEEKLHKMKECVTAIMECFEEAKEERYEREDYERDRARGGGDRYSARDREYDDYEDDDRDMARGRARGGRGRGRY